MIAFILKSSISLGVLYACYHLFFSRDKRFMFNRFFLLAALVFSLVVPFITLPAPFQHDYFDDSHLAFAEGEIQITRTKEHTPGGELSATSVQGYPLVFVVSFFYAAGVLIMFLRYVKNVRSIRKLTDHAQVYVGNGVRLILVSKPVSPFTFGRYVFVNSDAYRQGLIDEDIILHEKVHAVHLHTLDNLLIEFLLLLYWFNPLLWCYRAALRANHEFCADHIASSRCGIDAYCYKLIDLTSQQYNPLPGSGFNFSLTKNRILMMNRTKSSIFSFGRRLAVTGVAAVITLAVFSFKNVPSVSMPASGNAAFTVVIDAGHGGLDPGSHNDANTLLEKDLVLAIARAIDAADKDPAIKFIYTRSDDRMVMLRDRVQVAKDHHANLFLSLHVNTHKDAGVKGVEAYYSEKNPKRDLSARYCKMFASGVKLLEGGRAAVKTANFVVLKDNECPAVLLDLGFITNKEEASFLSSKKNRQKLAEEIVKTVSEISKL